MRKICPILTAGEWIRKGSEPSTILCEEEECAWWWIDACAIKAIATWIHEVAMRKET